MSKEKERKTNPKAQSQKQAELSHTRCPSRASGSLESWSVIEEKITVCSKGSAVRSLPVLGALGGVGPRSEETSERASFTFWSPPPS